MYDNILAVMAILKVAISVRSSKVSNASHWVDAMLFISCCKISKMYNSVIMIWSNDDESLMFFNGYSRSIGNDICPTVALK